MILMLMGQSLTKKMKADFVNVKQNLSSVKEQIGLREQHGIKIEFSED